MKDENTLYWIWLSERCGIASKEFGKLAVRYDNPFELYRMDEDEIEHLEGITPTLKARLHDKSLESSYAILRYCKANRVDVISYADARYPARLRNIETPPVLLYVLGKLPDMNRRLCVGIVGTRKMSEYGRHSAYKISYELASANAVIVSGMASGIDGVAACAALACGGSTVAVLGCGISVVYPKEHDVLMRAIGKHGAVVTEFPPNERPLRRNFPLRNRIISGLCQGSLVIEGPMRSGALITAKLTVEQGRELFVLPGNINASTSAGSNELIQSGARVVLSADDVLRHYDFLYHETIDYKGLRKAKSKTVAEKDALRRFGVSGETVETDVSTEETVEQSASVDSEAVPSKSVKTATTVKKGNNEQTLAKEIKHEDAPRASAKEDGSKVLLASLDASTRRVFEGMPTDRAVSPDALIFDGMGIGEVITSLTLLELSGLVSSLPGGVYIKR